MWMLQQARFFLKLSSNVQWCVLCSVYIFYPCNTMRGPEARPEVSEWGVIWVGSVQRLTPLPSVRSEIKSVDFSTFWQAELLCIVIFAFQLNNPVPCRAVSRCVQIGREASDSHNRQRSCDQLPCSLTKSRHGSLWETDLKHQSTRGKTEHISVPVCPWQMGNRLLIVLWCVLGLSAGGTITDSVTVQQYSYKQ